MDSFPPRHVCIVGALWIALGAGSVVEMVARLVEGRFSIDMGFWFIPLGYGLLAGSPLARKWALFLSIGGAVCSAGGWGCSAYAQWKDGGGGLPLSADDVFAVAERTFGLVFCLYVAAVLIRREHRAWFAGTLKQGHEVKSLAWAAAAAGAVFGFFTHLTEWRSHEMYEKGGAFRVRVTPYDARTGKGLVKLSFDSSEVSPRSDPKSGLPEVHAIFYGGADGSQYEFHGKAAQPFEVTLHAAGFRDKVITLCGKAEYEIRVPMQPLEDGATGKDAGGKAEAAKEGAGDKEAAAAEKE